MQRRFAAVHLGLLAVMWAAGLGFGFLFAPSERVEYREPAHVPILNVDENDAAREVYRRLGEPNESQPGQGGICDYWTRSTVDRGTMWVIGFCHPT